MGHNVTGPFASIGREVYIAEAVRTPTGKSHPERGWYRDTPSQRDAGRLLHAS